MPTRKKFAIPFCFSSLLILNAFLQLPLLAQTLGEFEDNRPTKKFAVTKDSPTFELELDYHKAFDVIIQSFNGDTTQAGFCTVVPSEISVKLEWTGPFPFDDDIHSYDNIVQYKNYYFILDSISFNILAIKDFRNPDSYITIFSDFENELNESNQFDEPFMVVDTPNGILYIVTEENLYSYDLNHFLTDITQPQNIQPIDTEALKQYYKGYESILNVIHYQNHLYIVADTIVDIFDTDKHGVVTPKLKLNAQFFGVNEISIADIAIQGNYAFVLDTLQGVFVVDISKSQSNEGNIFKYLPDLRTNLKVPKAEFIEVVGNSLNLVFPSTKNPYIEEYIILGEPEITDIIYNRKMEMFQAVRDTYSDKNFLYVLTGFFNIAAKHSIPEKYNSETVKNYVEEYWPLFGIKAMTSSTSNSTSKVVAIQDEFITLFTFTENNPIMQCNIENVNEGVYTFQIQAIQSTCPIKEKNIQGTSWDSVCLVREDIQLLLTNDASSIGNVAETNRQVFLLMIGIGWMSLLVIIFICLCGKYRRQYRHLEDQIKFHKIENDSTVQNSKANKVPENKNFAANSEQEINPDDINIQAELEKAEALEKEKAAKDANDMKPNADFGDIKPLDFDAIYGKAKDESF